MLIMTIEKTIDRRIGKWPHVDVMVEIKRPIIDNQIRLLSAEIETKTA
jgi:hypothetical protein